jgi:hypothetical protein
MIPNKVQLAVQPQMNIIITDPDIGNQLNRIQSLLVNNHIEITKTIEIEGHIVSATVDEEVKFLLIEFFNNISKIKDPEQLFSIITKIFITIVESCQKINKNIEKVRYLYNRNYFYIFINKLIEVFYVSYFAKDDYNISVNLFIKYLKRLQSCFKGTEKDNDFHTLIIIENNIKKLFTKITTKYYLLDILYEKNTVFKIFKHLPKDNYNILEFIIAFCLFLTNINDFTKYSFKTAQPHKSSRENIQTLLHDNNPYYNNDTYIKRLHTFYEGNVLDYLFNDDKPKHELFFSVLIKCKKIIWNLPITEDIHYSSKIKILFLNFLVNFEKSLYKLVDQPYGTIPIEGLLQYIYRGKLYDKIKYFYDFRFFVKLLTYFIKHNILDPHDDEIINEEIRKMNDLIALTNSNLQLIQKDVKTNDFLSFFLVCYASLIGNYKYHHFTIIPKNRKKLSNINLDNSSFYNKNYINFKKVYDFVRDFNDLVDYYCSIFSINISTRDVKKIMRSSATQLVAFNSIFSLYMNMSHVYYNKCDNEEFTPEFNPIISTLRKEKKPGALHENIVYGEHEPCIYANELNSYSKFLKSFLILTKDASNFIILNDISIENTIEEKDIKNYFLNNIFSPYLEKKIKDEKKNLLLTYTVNNNKSINHASCIIINFEKGYVDFYNSLNIYKVSDVYRAVYGKVYESIELYLKYLITEKFKDFKINSFNHFDNMAKFQFEYDSSLFNNYCHYYTLIYEFVRLLYFNKTEYTMNYVQEKINEYFMSFNHLVYFLVVFTFLYVLRCSNIPELYNLIFYTDQNGKKLFKCQLLNQPENPFFEYPIYTKYRKILLNIEIIKAINNNFNKLFKPLKVKSLHKNIDRIYNINLNNNINIFDNNNFALQDHRHILNEPEENVNLQGENSNDGYSTEEYPPSKKIKK